jgi:hypothetical protein
MLELRSRLDNPLAGGQKENSFNTGAVLICQTGATY